MFGAIASLIGTGLSLFGASSAEKSQEKAQKQQLQQQKQYEKKQALADKKAAEASAKISKEILALQNGNMQENIQTLQRISAYQKAATKAAATEQKHRKQAMLTDAHFANDATMRSFLQARGEAAARASEQTGAVGGSGVFGSLGNLWTSSRRALLEVNLDVQAGLNIFNAQADQAYAITHANDLQTKQSVKNLEANYDENVLRSKLGAAAIPAAVSAPTPIVPSSSGSGLVAAGNALSGAAGSIQRFENQIFGTPTAKV